MDQLSFNDNEKTQYRLLKELLKRDTSPNKPKKIANKNGQFTKLFEKWNRNEMKKGTTFFYAPKDKFYNPSTKRFINFRYDNRKKNKSVLVPSQLKLKFNLGVNTTLLNSTNIESYYRKTILNIKRLANSETTTSMILDLKKINFDSMIKLIIKYGKDKRFISTVGGSNKWITFSKNNLQELKSIDNLTYKSEGSDVKFLYKALEYNGIIEIKNVIGIVNENEGNFFNYYNRTHYDFTRYDIYNEQNLEYNHNCLYIALKNGGLEIEKLNKFKLITTNGFIPSCKLTEICNKLKICIRLSKIINNQETRNRKQQTFGNKNDQKFDIGLIDKHFFIIEKTLNTRYSLEHYDDIKDIKNSNEIKGVRSNGKYHKDKSKFINSFDLVKILLEQKEELLKKIPYDVLTETPYFSNEMNTDDLTEIGDEEYKTNEPIKTDNSDCYSIFFDFETYTDGKHTPYLVRCKTQDGDKKVFYGDNCGEQLMDYIKRLEVDYKKFLLIAHNFRYDFSFIWKHIYSLNPLINGTRMLGGSGKLYKGSKEYVEVKFQDSYNLISTKLSAFGKMFNLPQGKEMMPYSIYTKKNVKEGMKIEDALKCKELKNNPDNIKIFKENIKKWKCDLHGKFDFIKYSDKYCEIDVDVLKGGYDNFREQIKEVCKLDIKNYLTSASIAHDYMVSNDVYDGSFAISGIPRAFIQKCVYGGKTMTRRNEKFKINSDTADFDAVSCYPSAMVEMDGVLKGLPKLLQPSQLNDQFLNSVDGYFIKVKCLNNPNIKLDFPIISEIGEDGNRLYTNDNIGKFYYLDKTTYEDCKNFIGLKFDVLCGYYYNEGRNPKMKEVVNHLFNERRKMKKLKNPIQSVYKLLLNSSYGKSMLKPINTNGVVVHKKNYDKYVSKHYNYIKEMYKLNDDVWYIKSIKAINEHFNNVYLGVEILSMAKRIMNRVMVNAERLKIPLYYTDTDSMHIDYDGVNKIAKFYYETYKKDLIGKDLGQFHVDFELKGALDETIKSKKSIYLGKKCYYDYLEGYDQNGNLIKGEHIRMKGIPHPCLEYTANKKFNGNMYKMYEHLLEGKPVSFDLLCDGNAIKFQYDGFDVKSLGYYKKDEKGNKLKCNYDKEAISEFSRTLKF